MASRSIAWLLLAGVLASPAALYVEWRRAVEPIPAAAPAPAGLSPPPPAAEPEPSPPPRAPSEAPSSARADTFYRPSSQRDPTVSLLDEALERWRGEQALRPTPVPDAPEPKTRADSGAELRNRIRVEGVVGVAGRFTALVNGRLVKRGDSVLGARVEAISIDGVRFRYGRTRFYKDLR